MDMVSGLKVSLMNVNGINGMEKQKRVFTYFDSIYSDILILIDTRLRNAEKENDFINKTNIYDIYSTYSTGINTSRGVSILINKALPIEIKKIHRDIQDNNYLMLETVLYEKPLLLTGVYGPNTDSPQFIKKIFDMEKATGIELKINSGDYNITRHPCLDNENYTGNNNKKARKMLNQLIKQEKYYDPLREKNSEGKLYTYYSYQGNQRARLDYVFTSEQLAPAIVDCYLLDMPVSDHRGVTIKIDFAKFSKGKGLWRFPQHLLKMEDYPPIVHKAVKDIYMKYYRSEKYKDFYVEATDAERAEFGEFSWEELPKLPMKRNIKTIYEEILLAIRGETVKFAHQKRCKTNEEIKIIRTQIQLLDLDKDLKREDFINENRKLTEKIEILTRDKYFQKEVEWIQAGERLSPTLKAINTSTKMQRFMPIIIETDADGKQTVITNQSDIEGKQKTYYETLYKKQDVNEDIKIEDFLPDGHESKKITDDTKERLEQLITLQELTDALEDTSNNSCPGEDGFGYTFYKAFWPVLKHTVLAVANRTLISRNLPTSQKNGIINLIPKGNKDRKYLENWRPIMLLNCCYKLISSVLARRLQDALKEIVSPDQTGFLQDRYINENNVITCEVLEDAKARDKLGLMLAIDFSKAFDCLNHAYIRKVLHHFGFGPKYIAYVNTLITDFQAAVIHAGNISEYFKLQRGAKQGDPLAALLFILAVEILSIRLKEDKDIEHYKMEHGVIVKLILYADDLNLFMEYSEKSLQKAIQILKEFKDISGLEIQVKKTQVVLLGRKYIESEHRLCKDMQMKWDQKFRLLGLDYDAYNVKDRTVNYSNKLDEIFEEMSGWRTKFISIRARKNIVNGLFLSKLTHIAAVLPNLPAKEIKSIESRLYDFIWSGTSKLEREESKLSFESGGMNFPDLRAAWNALKLSWIRRLEYGHKTKWHEIFRMRVKQVSTTLDVNNIVAWSTTQINTLTRKIKSSIWKSILNSLMEYIRKDIAKNKTRAFKHNIWGMKILKTKSGNIITHAKVKTLEENNILPVELINPGSPPTTKNVQEILAKYNKLKPAHVKLAIEALDVYIDSIKDCNIDDSFLIPCQTYLRENIHKFKKGSSWWVKSLKYNEHVFQKVLDREKKWTDMLKDSTLDREFWNSQYKMVHKIKFDNKIHIVQFQIMKRNIRTNINVHKFKSYVSEECSFGCKVRETPEHLFFNCTKVQALIKDINNKLKVWTDNREFNTIKDFLFMEKMKHLNIRETLKLMTKYYIWRTRCSGNIDELHIEGLKTYIYNFMLPHKKAKTLTFLQDIKVWTDLDAG